MPWRVTIEVNSINRLRNGLTIRVQTSLREGNTFAVFFAKLVFDYVCNIEYNNFQKILVQAKKIFYLDKQRIPNVSIMQTGLLT